jgi:hypothetical protein
MDAVRLQQVAAAFLLDVDVEFQRLGVAEFQRHQPRLGVVHDARDRTAERLVADQPRFALRGQKKINIHAGPFQSYITIEVI